MIVAIGLCGCGSSSPAKTTITTVVDAAPPRTEVAAGQIDTAVPDTTGVTAPDTTTVSVDTLTPMDAPQVVDTLPPTTDSTPTPTPDSGTVATSTSTIDHATTLCSTVALGTKELKTDQTYDIVIPTCPRVSGTVSLATPLPTGAVWGNGSVNVMKIVRDGNNKVSDTVSYAATITAVDGTHFKYSVGVPEGAYEMMFIFTIKSSDLIPTTATRYAQETITIGPGVVHDVTLPAIEVNTLTATVTGTEALAASANQFGRFIEVLGLGPKNTLMTMGMAMTSGAQIPVNMWVPKNGMTPFIMVVDTPSAMAPYPSGFTSQFKLDFVAPTSNFTLAMPPVAKISGSVSDPNHSLSPMLGVGATTSAVNYYHCNSMDYGTYPDPIFFYPEGSASNFFAAATSHALYSRKGIECITYANYAIATGPGGMPTRAGENTYAFMEDPTPKSPNVITLTGDLTRDILVPALGTQVTVPGTVKDSQGNAIGNAQVDFNSSALSAAMLADKTFVGSLDVAANGTFTIHALPGTYTLWVKLKDTQGAAPTPDAGSPKDTGPAFTLPDVSFTLPDLGNAGDCAALATCCATLSATNKMVCDMVVSSNMAASCGAYLTSQKQSGACP